MQCTQNPVRLRKSNKERKNDFCELELHSPAIVAERAAKKKVPELKTAIFYKWIYKHSALNFKLLFNT